jgi:hypothetical protein
MISITKRIGYDVQPTDYYAEFENIISNVTHYGTFSSAMTGRLKSINSWRVFKRAPNRLGDIQFVLDRIDGVEICPRYKTHGLVVSGKQTTTPTQHFVLPLLLVFSFAYLR